MRVWFKVTLLIVAVCALCWGGVIIYWQETGREPSTADLAFLLLLPLSLLALFWIGRKLLSLRVVAPSVAIAPAAAPAAPAPAPAAALALFGGALRTPHGASADELAGALEKQRARADLDPELVDDDGFPILSARLPDGPDAALRGQIEAWLDAREREYSPLVDEQWRALAMGTEVARELASRAIDSHQPRDAAALPAGVDGQAVQAPMLQTILLLSTAWNDSQRGAATAWISQVLGEAGWPEARRSVIAAPGAPLPALGASLAMLSAKASAGAQPLLAMVLAFDSQIGEDSVNRLAAGGRLMVSSQPQGQIPGEGAAGLLLGDARQASLTSLEAAQLRALAGAREGSADASGRPDTALLRKLAGQLLDDAPLPAPDVARLLSDTDHRTSRTLELMAFASEALPHLDASADIASLGSACGDCAAVPFIGAIVLAYQHALDAGRAVLCVSNNDPYHRSAVLVRPPALQS